MRSLFIHKPHGFDDILDGIDDIEKIPSQKKSNSIKKLGDIDGIDDTFPHLGGRDYLDVEI
jgi:hypothetical protein